MSYRVLNSTIVSSNIFFCSIFNCYIEKLRYIGNIGVSFVINKLEKLVFLVVSLVIDMPNPCFQLILSRHQIIIIGINATNFCHFRGNLGKIPLLGLILIFHSTESLACRSGPREVTWRLFRMNKVIRNVWFQATINI